ncbi:MAG TPA: hypothetical protein VF581_03690 [Flavobacterium sp.]|jgi:hypothetical protein
MKSVQRTTANNARAFKPKPRAIENFEDLYDESLQDVHWTERALLKAMPKAGVKIKKMKS